MNGVICYLGTRVDGEHCSFLIKRRVAKTKFRVQCPEIGGYPFVAGTWRSARPYNDGHVLHGSMDSCMSYDVCKLRPQQPLQTRYFVAGKYILRRGTTTASRCGGQHAMQHVRYMLWKPLFFRGLNLSPRVRPVRLDIFDKTMALVSFVPCTPGYARCKEILG